MCICSLAVNSHARFHLILLNNRDEQVDRETSRLQIHFHENDRALITHDSSDSASTPQSALLLARDMHYGRNTAPGSWMGLNIVTGAFAVVTNVLEPILYIQDQNDKLTIPQHTAHPNTLLQISRTTETTTSTDSQQHQNHHYLSRGHLVYEALTGNPYQTLRENGLQYGPFNLFFGNIWPHTSTTDEHSFTTFCICSNRKQKEPTHPTQPLQNLHKVTDGVHAFSNSFFDDEEWPKVQYVKKALEQKLQKLHDERDPDILLQELIPLMRAQNVVEHLDNDLRSPSSQSRHKLSKTIIPEYLRKQLASDDENIQENFTNLLNNVWISEHHLTNKFMTVSQTVMFASHDTAFYYYHVTNHFGESHKSDHSPMRDTTTRGTSSLLDVEELKKTIRLYNLDGVQVSELHDDGGWVRLECARPRR